MDFLQFFPLFRDSIMGLTFLHLKNIAHRDIKPRNIFKISENKYTIAGFELGRNLYY